MVLFGQVMADEHLIVVLHLHSDTVTISLDYAGSMSWQHVLAPQLRLVDLCSANVTTMTALPQNKVQTLTGCRVKYEIKTTIYPFKK